MFPSQWQGNLPHSPMKPPHSFRAAVTECETRVVYCERNRMGDVMSIMKAYAAGFCAAAIASATLVAVPAEAQTQPQKKYVSSTSRTATANRARARVVVAPRSILDAGTEVLPGERKITDYAIPPGYTPQGVVTNTGGRVGWHQSPLPGPFDLAGPRNPFGW
jgi:hypothetical protein